MGRFDILDQIQQLDPERDNMKIMYLSFGYEFSWDSIRSLEIALYRTYCAPSISALLDRTGEFRRRTQRRYDDTSLLVAEMCKWGYLEGRGKEALERTNWAHGHYKISNEDFLYVLSTFIYEPIYWIDKYDWRPTCEQERKGYYYFWREVGIRMKIKDIPPSYEEFENWKHAYEENISSLRRRTTVSASLRGICLRHGSRASLRRSYATPFTQCSMKRCWSHSAFRNRLRLRERLLIRVYDCEDDSFACCRHGRNHTSLWTTRIERILTGTK